MNNAIPVNRAPLLSPARLLLVLVCLVFLQELLLMCLERWLPPMAGWAFAWIDAAALALLMLPSLFLLVFRPLTREMAERGQAEAELTERVRLATLAAEMGNTFAASDALPDCLRRSAEAMVRHLDLALARIWKLNPADNVLDLQASAGLYTLLNGLHGRVPLGRLEIGLIAQERKPRLTNQLQTDPSMHDPEWVRREGLVAFAGYPMLVGGQLIGVLALFARHPFTELTFQAMGPLANALALAIERQSATQQLRDSETLYHSLVEKLPQNIFRKDRQGRFTFGNQRYCQLVGKSLPELVGKTDADLFPPELAAKYQADDRGVMEGGAPLELVEEHQTPDGKRLYVQTVKTPLVDAQGTIIGLQGIFWDITERKRAEETLAHERNLLRTLIDTLPDYMYIKDTDHRFLLGNRALAGSFGKAASEEIEGKTDRDFHPPDLAARFAAEEQAVLRSGEPLVNQEEYIIEPAGAKKWLLTTKVPVRSQSGKIVGLVGVGRDITKLREAEDERRRLIQELQNALGQVKKLSGLLPICAGCKKIRDEETSQWQSVDSYIVRHSEAKFSHGLCPDCLHRLYPDLH